MGDDSDAEFGETGEGRVTLSVDNLAPHSHDVTNLRRAVDKAGENADGFHPGWAFDDGGEPGRFVVFWPSSGTKGAYENPRLSNAVPDSPTLLGDPFLHKIGVIDAIPSPSSAVPYTPDHRRHPRIGSRRTCIQRTHLGARRAYVDT